MSDSRLKIEADALELELSGDTDYVVETYNALRPVLKNYLEESMSAERRARRAEAQTEQKQSDQSAKPGRKKHNTDPLFHKEEQDDATPPLESDDEKVLPPTQLEFVVCTDLYYRISALPREQFKETFLHEAIAPEALTAVYVDRDTVDELRDEVDVGKTLWRELTEQGQAAVHGDSS